VPGLLVFETENGRIVEVVAENGLVGERCGQGEASTVGELENHAGKVWLPKRHANTNSRMENFGGAGFSGVLTKRGISDLRPGAGVTSGADGPAHERSTGSRESKTEFLVDEKKVKSQPLQK